MELAVISDLHLGRGDPGDRFRHDDGAFLRFLDHLERNFERIVLLGDVWETLGSRRLGDYVAELGRAQAAHPEIARRFRHPRYAYVHGNHDLVARRVWKAPGELTIQADGVRLFLTHGHDHDWIIHRLNWLAELGSWVGAALLRWGQEALFHVLDRWYSGRPDRDPSRCSFRRWALALAETQSADVIVTAHTHAPACELHGPRLFMNSGTCAYGRYSFLGLDTRTQRFELHRSGW
jgi:predicted phosphodiesterase